MKINVHTASPIFRVSNLANSIAYYESKLGFKVDWIHEEIFASITRGQANLMLCQGDQGKGEAWVYIGVGDTEMLFKEFEKKGARIRQQPTNFAWALEMRVEDPDGNVIRFGSDTKEDVPFGPCQRLLYCLKVLTVRPNQKFLVRQPKKGSNRKAGSNLHR